MSARRRGGTVSTPVATAATPRHRPRTLPAAPVICLSAGGDVTGRECATFTSLLRPVGGRCEPWTDHHQDVPDACTHQTGRPDFLLLNSPAAALDELKQCCLLFWTTGFFKLL